MLGKAHTSDEPTLSPVCGGSKAQGGEACLEHWSGLVLLHQAALCPPCTCMCGPPSQCGDASRAVVTGCDRAVMLEPGWATGERLLPLLIIAF